MCTSPSLFRSQRNAIGISTVADAAATINAPEVIFYKPSRSPQNEFMGFHVQVKRCLNPSDYFFLWNNRSNG